MLGTALVAGAVVLAPYVLPAVGLGSSDLALEALTALHGCVGLGSGLANAINIGLSAIPLVGPTLEEGGLISAAASGIIGIGGVLLGKFIEKKHDGKTGINWGRVIKVGALLTSALIAMPSILTGMTVGLVYLSAAFSGGNVSLATEAGAFLAKTMGVAGAHDVTAIGWSGAVAALPHLLTCGGALFPALISAKLASAKENPSARSAARMPAQAGHVKPARQSANGAIVATLEMDRAPAANQPSKGKLRLTDARTGLPVTYDELAVTHARKLHLYITDQSLKEYHHIHPHPTNEPGVLTFSFTPRTSNQYNAWADFTLMKDGSNHRVKIEIPSAVRRNIPAVIRARTQAEQDGLVFNWKSSAPLQKDTPAIVEVHVTDRQGNPVTDLEPVMGAFAHLAGFSADGKHFIHTHPLGMEPTGPDERGGPRLRFQVEPDYAGPTQFYLQICRNGREMHLPFGQQIASPGLPSAETRNVDYKATHPGHGI